MPILSRKNQYHGVNAHLNSSLQQLQGDWETFHSHHIGEIHIQLNDQLRGTGTIAKLEKGLQICREGLPNPTILEVGGQYKVMDATSAIITPHPDEETAYYKAVSVYATSGEVPIAWIELLSPSNKKKGRHYETYLERRYRLLQAEICSYIEIDYLHRSSPIVHDVLDYSKNEAQSKPYRVSLIDTRFGIESGKAYILEFDIDEPIPNVLIPLKEGDTVNFELAKAYQSTFYRVGYGINDDTLIDYQTLPPNFDTYSLDDQRKIMRRMLAVIDAAQQGINLEAGDTPLPIDAQRLQSLAAQLNFPEITFEIF